MGKTKKVKEQIALKSIIALITSGVLSLILNSGNLDQVLQLLVSDIKIKYSLLEEMMAECKIEWNVLT